jgi:hypothetical protein
LSEAKGMNINMKNNNRKFLRPTFLEGWMSIILSLLFFLYIVFIGLLLTDKNIKNYISLIPVTVVSLLLYFYGLRNISKGRKASDKYYLYKSKITIIFLLSAFFASICFISIKYIPENNRTNEVVIANAQIINCSNFNKEIIGGIYYIVVTNYNLRISCSKSIYDLINLEYSYRIKYRWNFFSPKKCYLVSIKKIDLMSTNGVVICTGKDTLYLRCIRKYTYRNQPKRSS